MLQAILTNWDVRFLANVVGLLHDSVVASLPPLQREQLGHWVLPTGGLLHNFNQQRHTAKALPMQALLFTRPPRVAAPT